LDQGENPAFVSAIPDLPKLLSGLPSVFNLTKLPSLAIARIFPPLWMVSAAAPALWMLLAPAVPNASPGVESGPLPLSNDPSEL
jgi:hypothetical protein